MRRQLEQAPHAAVGIPLRDCEGGFVQFTVAASSRARFSSKDGLSPENK
jgi:hypothetical protein